MAFVAGNALVVVGVFLTVFLLTATDARAVEAWGPRGQLCSSSSSHSSSWGSCGRTCRTICFRWTLESIGVLGWLTISLPPASTSRAPGGSRVLLRMREGVASAAWRRALLAAVGVAVFVTMAVALYAFLEPTGSDKDLHAGPLPGPRVAAAAPVRLRHQVRAETARVTFRDRRIAGDDGTEREHTDVGLRLLSGTVARAAGPREEPSLARYTAAIRRVRHLRRAGAS